MIWFLNLKTRTKNSSTKRKLSRKTRPSVTGKATVIFTALKATENKSLVLYRALCLVYCFMVCKVLLYPFSVWLSQSLVLGRNYYTEEGVYKECGTCLAQSWSFTSENTGVQEPKVTGPVCAQIQVFTFPLQNTFPRPHADFLGSQGTERDNLKRFTYATLSITSFHRSC